MLSDEKFYELFYKEYREGHSEVETLYKRCQLAVAAITLVAGVVGAVTRRDLLSGYWTRVDVFLYYTFAGSAALCLACASICLVFSIKPRKFEKINTLRNWLKWRLEYRDEVTKSEFGTSHPALVDQAVARVVCEQVIQRLAEAADWNADLIRTKRKWFDYGFYFTVAAMGAVAVQAFMHAVLFFNRVELP
jgi:hypothetical protein